MSFTDTEVVEDLHLGARISIKDGDVWVMGKVVELALLGDDYRDVRITLLLDDDSVQVFDRKRGSIAIIEW